MSNVEFFTRFGFLVAPRFLEPSFCSELMSEMRGGVSRPGTVMGAAGELEIDQRTRRVESIKVQETVEAAIAFRLAEIKPKLERHFNHRLEAPSRPGFLLYRKGGCYRTHSDSTPDQDAPDYIRRRRVSVVLFVNSESETVADDCYCGGALSFYGLLKDPRVVNRPFPLHGESGLLVAFRSEILHSVEEITAGERYTVVSWYLQDSAIPDMPRQEVATSGLHA